MLQKNQIFIDIADDLRTQVGSYEDKTAKTPNLDKLVMEGIRFTNANVTAGNCSPSRGSIMTRLYPHQNGLYSLCWGKEEFALLHDDVPKLPF